MNTSHAREGQAESRAKPSSSVVSVWCHVILTGTRPSGSFPHPPPEKILIDMSNNEIARGVTKWQMKLEQCYMVSVVLIEVATA